MLAACGGDGEGGARGGSDTTSAPEVAGGLVLFKVFPERQPVGVPVRLPLALASQDNDLDIDLPDSIGVELRPPADGTAPEPLRIERHAEGIPRGYYPLRATLDVAGPWGIVVDAGGTRVETTIEAVDATSLPAVPASGDALPSVRTPTTADARGVDPICTRDPQCPFHEVSLDEAIGGTGPICCSSRRRPSARRPSAARCSTCSSSVDPTSRRRARR